jgi:hypothetical protein
MRLKTLVVTSIAGFAIAAVGTGSASAATEFGDTCAINKSSSETVTLFEVKAPGNPLPVAAPVSGVITAWKVNVISVPTSFPQTLQVLRLDTAAKIAHVVGETAATLTGGANVIPARIPVQTGDRLAVAGPKPTGTLYCEVAETATYGGYTGLVGAGSSSPYSEATGGVRVPAAATIEPDADGDGYGDETQDKCPQSAAVQAECPLVVLDTFAVAGTGRVVVIVGASTEAPVTVTGSVKLPKAAKKASASATAKLKKVTHTVTPGKIGRFVLKFPSSLKNALTELPASKSLKLKITASATNVAGQASKDTSTLKLKG